MFRLGVITDEISTDVERAVKVARDLNLECIELRQCWNKNVKDLTDGEVRRIRRLAKEYDLEVISIASPFFKCNIDNEDEVKKHLGFLQRLIDITKTFDAEILRCFAFWSTGRLEDYWDEMIERLSEAVEICASEGVIYALENEHATFVGTGSEAERVVKAIGKRNLRVVWDPGNSFCAGEKPYPDGYMKVRDHTVHIHLKDAVRDKTTKTGYRFVAIGKGEIDYRGQFKALIEDGYTGCASLETHYKIEGDGEKSTRETLKGLRNILKELGVTE